MADRGETFKENILKDGHINYLVQAIAMLYAGYRRDKARELYDWIRENYDPRGEEWKLDLEDFILFRLGRDGAGNREVADSQVTAALVAGLEFLARGNDEAYRRCVAYARRVYDLYQKGSPDRVKLVPFDYYARGLLAGMLVRPQGYYRPLSLVERSLLYARSDPRLQVLVYDAITPLLRPQCEGQGFDFDRAFPEPPGLEEFRADQRRELGPPER